jgi:two-component system, NarL family, sensor histidine kinase UhpB
MDDSVRVLLIEDNPGDARLVEAALSEVVKPRFSLRHADRLSTGLLDLAAERVDVILLDLGLPDSQGMETLEAVRTFARRTPVVVLSGSQDEQVALEAVQASAQDFIVKAHADSYILARSLCYAIERKRGEEALRESEERFRLAMVVANEIIWEYDACAGAVTCDEPFDPGPGGAEFLRGFPLGAVYDPDRERVGRSLYEALNGTAAVWEFEYRIVTGSGNLAHIFNRALIVRDRAGKAKRVVGAMLDVTARQRSEQALQEANRQLRELSHNLLRSQDYERRRIARELHDSTSQLLVAIGLNLNRALDPNMQPGRRLELTREALGQVGQCGREIRTVSYLLHPPLLDEVGLVSALKQYAEGFHERTAIQVRLRIPDDFGRLSSELEVTLFRIVQEGLANVHRHSGSPSAVIALERDGSNVRLVVEDSGRGFSSTAVQIEKGFVRFGVGISGMRERAKQLGGALEIRNLATGTQIVVTLPLVGPHEETENLSRR